MKNSILTLILSCAIFHVFTARADGWLGVNLDGLADYSSTETFNDAMKSSRRWGRPREPWKHEVKTDDLGWPVEDAGVIVFADRAPEEIEGRYLLAFDGQATVEPLLGCATAFCATAPPSACLLLPCQRAGDFVATVRPVHFGRFRRPCDRSPYTSTASGRSPAGIAANCFGVLGWRRRNRPRMARFGPGAGWPRPHRSLRASAAPPPAASAADPRRGASSRDTAPGPARASARLPRTGGAPSPCDRSSAASPGPDPGKVAFFVRSVCARPPPGGLA